MLLALLLAAAPILANEQVAVWEAKSELGPLQHDAIVVDFATASARLVPKGTAPRAAAKAVVIELLAPPAAALPNTTGFPDAFDRPGIEKLLETERVTVWRYQWQPQKRTPMHFHGRDAVVTFLADGVLKSITADGKSVENAHSFGMTRLGTRGRVHQEELVKGEARAVIVELK